MGRVANRQTLHLNLWKQRLGRVPKSVWQHPDLQTLVLAGNDLTEVSDQIGNLLRLRDLRQSDLRGNLLTALPDGLSTLPRLERLDREARGCLIYRSA